MSFAVVDQKLWLLYLYNPLAVQGPVIQTTPLDVMNSIIKVNATKKCMSIQS